MKEFSHYRDGCAKMVDISQKEETVRKARAYGAILIQKKTLELIEKKLVPKGDPFEVARIAGIMAAKKNAELIPLCHSVNLGFVDVQMSMDANVGKVEITSEVQLIGATGAEMEALTAVTIAALTLFDMCKAVDDTMVITDIHVLEKKGGKTDIFSKKNEQKR